VPQVHIPPLNYLFCQLTFVTQWGVFDQGQVSGTCYTISQAAQACCFADGSCVDARPDECVFIGGVSQGQGTACESSPCIATAVESRSWGRLKGLYPGIVFIERLLRWNPPRHQRSA
jgi:hypothetical protein